MQTITHNNDNVLGTQSVKRLLWNYSLPAIVGTMLSSLYNIFDRIFIGQGVGSLAISGLALTFPFMTLISAFALLVGAGAASRISIRIGENRIDLAEKILGNTFTLTFILSGTLAVVSYIFMDDLLFLLGGSKNTLRYAKEFMEIIIPGSIFAAINFGFNNIMRASGHPKKAMVTMLITTLINLILTPLFIYTFGWGIAGAAYATIIAFFVGSVWVLFHFINKKNNLCFKKENFILDKKIVGSILSIGMSPFSMQIAASVVVIIVNHALKTHGGDLAIGALGIQNSIATVIVMFIVGVTQGAQPIWGFNYGAGKLDRVFETLKWASVVATAITTIGFLLTILFPYTIAGFFTTDEELKELAVTALRITLLIFPVVGAQIVFTHFFQAIGRAKISMLLSITRQILFLIPALLILPPKLGLKGVWIAMPVSDTLAVFVTTTTLIVFVKRFKKKNKIDT